MPISVERLNDSPIILMKFEGSVSQEDQANGFQQSNKLIENIVGDTGLLVDMNNYRPTLPAEITDTTTPISILNVHEINDKFKHPFSVIVIIPPFMIAHSLKQNLELFKNDSATTGGNIHFAENLK